MNQPVNTILSNQQLAVALHNHDLEERLRALRGSGGGSPGNSYSSEYQAWLTYLSSNNIINPSSNGRTSGNTFILALKTAGILAITDELKIYATSAPVAATDVNIASPGNNTSSRIKGPVYTKNDGVKNDGVQTYIDLNWAPSNGVNYTLNSCERIIGYKEISAGSFFDGVRDSSGGLNGTVLNPYNAASQAVYENNGTQAVANNAQFNGGDDLYFHGRLNNTTVFIRKGSNARVTASAASDGRTTRTDKLGTLDTNGSFSTWNTRKLTIHWVGGLLTVAQEDAFLSAWNAYVSSISSEPSTDVILGTLYDKSSWTDLSDFTNGGSTASVVGNAIQFSAGANTFTQVLNLNRHTCLEYWKQTATFTTPSSLTVTTYGFGVGLKSVNPGSDIAIQFVTQSGSGNLGKCLINSSAAGTYTVRATSAALPFSAGDQIQIILERVRNVFIVTANNLTAPASVSVSYTYTAVIMPNTSRFCIYSYGGTFLLNSYKVESNELKNKTVFLGDSKTQMYFASDINYRFTTLIGDKQGRNVNLGGTGDRSSEYLLRMQEVIDLQPTKVHIVGISNDIRGGISSAVWQANILACISLLDGANIPWVFHTGLYETMSQAAVKTWANANLPAAKVADYVDTVIGLSGDNIHPNDAGHVTYGDTVINSGKL